MTRLLPLRVPVQLVAVKMLLFASTSWSLSSPSPTAADIRFDQWCDDNSIFRVGVQTVTTPKSLGGRGLFATKPLVSGSVVASIPAKLIIVADDDVEWQVSLTNQVTSRNKDVENEWIQSWHGSGSLELAYLLEKRDDQSAVDDFVKKLVGQGKITQQGATKEVRSRIQNFEKRLEFLDCPEDAAKWYSLVMSRAAYLGKDWDYRTGAIPFFDMLNHCHDSSRVNTELMTFGACLDRSAKDSEGSSQWLDRRDQVLVLTKDIKEGSELLTMYETNVDKEESQLQLLVQYGIPPPDGVKAKN